VVLVAVGLGDIIREGGLIYNNSQHSTFASHRDGILSTCIYKSVFRLTRRRSRGSPTPAGPRCPRSCFCVCLTCVRACVCVCVCGYTHDGGGAFGVYAHIHTFSLPRRLYISIYHIHIHPSIHLPIHPCIHASIHAYTRTHTHTHTNPPPPKRHHPPTHTNTHTSPKNKI
jgi:hypothetical protein